METVLYWNGTFKTEFNKKELANFLYEYTLNYSEDSPIYIPEVQGLFKNVFEIVLTYLHETTCIQIYNDGVIRLHLKSDSAVRLKYSGINVSNSIVIDNTYSNMTHKLKECIIAFSYICAKNSLRFFC